MLDAYAMFTEIAWEITACFSMYTHNTQRSVERPETKTVIVRKSVHFLPIVLCYIVVSLLIVFVAGSDCSGDGSRDGRACGHQLLVQ